MRIGGRIGKTEWSGEKIVMKIRSFNGSEHIESECGSFTNLSRELNYIFKERGIYSEDEDATTIFPECLDTQRKFKNQIPFLACEYSQPPAFVTHWLRQYNPIVICISKFAKNNLIRGGYPEELVYVSHLGNNAAFWTPADIEKFPHFTYLTINTSNDRSGYNILLPEFIKFAQGKDIKLYIKDGQNDKFQQWVKSIDVENKIIYDGRRLSKIELRDLYRKSHINLYYNSTTSYGLNVGDGALCGTPTIATFSTAIREFLPEWTQPPLLVKTTTKSLDAESISTWQNIGLHSPPIGMYPEGTTRQELDPTNIIASLEYVYDNYLEMQKKNQEHRQFILQNLGWDKTVTRILDVLEKCH